MTRISNIFDFPEIKGDEEIVEALTDGETKIERIISTGQVTPEGEWYDQSLDEWVVLLEGEAKLLFEETGEVYLKPGDYILIKAHERHRVVYTSTLPPCLWLAVHGKHTTTK